MAPIYARQPYVVSGQPSDANKFQLNVANTDVAGPGEQYAELGHDAPLRASDTLTVSVRVDCLYVITAVYRLPDAHDRLPETST